MLRDQAERALKAALAALACNDDGSATAYAAVAVAALLPAGERRRLVAGEGLLYATDDVLACLRAGTIEPPDLLPNEAAEDATLAAVAGAVGNGVGTLGWAETML